MLDQNSQKNAMALGSENCPLPDERWAKKAAKWNPGLSTTQQTNRPVGRPNKRWEDEINDFLKPEETEETKPDEKKKNDASIKTAKKREIWKAMESEYAKTASVDRTHSRRYSQQDPVRPARYLNGVKLDEYEVATIALPHTKDQYDID